ncbi:MAG TPA: hypothetical protein ENI33_00885, partial [Thermoplasmatales archaeon]|nr:hypothetical protein [Thermoplasmatales archaeon]
QTAQFSTGTHDWEYSEKIIELQKPVQYLCVYALFRYHTGRVWFDDVKIVKTDYYFLNASLNSNSNKIYQNKTLLEGNIIFNTTYISHERYIEVNCRIKDTSDEDRALTVYFSLPINLSGWKWGDDIRNERIINFDGENIYKNWRWFGNKRYISQYPFSSISNESIGICYGIPLEYPVIFRTYYIKNLYTICFDIALSNKTVYFPSEANFSFFIYKNDYPEWNFRGGVSKYYEIFPKYFVKKVENEGIWMPFTDISTINNSEDFCFMFHEGNNNVKWDDAHGIYSFVYTEPWFYWQDMGDYNEKPNETNVLQRLYENLNSSNVWRKMNSRAVVICGVYNKSGGYFFDIRNAPWISGSGWSALFATNTDPEIIENETYWNKAHVIWNLTIEPAFQQALIENATLDGVYLDSLQGYFWYLNDYREGNFENITFPLSFDSDGVPVIVELFSHYKFTKNVSEDMHENEKLVMANGMGTLSFFFFPLIDVSGTEINWFPDGKFHPASDKTLNFLRTLSYKKPYLFLMNTNFNLMSNKEVELYFKKCTFYGMYPSMFSHNACNERYWENSTLYNRDRGLFKKYIPLIKEIGMAGWQPLTFAKSNNSNVYVERYGNENNDTIYFTLHNPTNSSQNFSLRIYSDELNLKGVIKIKELIENRSLYYGGINGVLLLNGSMEENDTWIIKIEKINAYYVATWGNDTNPGTFDMPWLTIQHASNIMKAGDIVFIRNGIYHEQVFTTKNGNSTDGYITFSAYPGERVVIDGNGVNTGNTGFFISHSYIKMKGIEICNWNDTGIWITNSSNIEISDCVVHDVFYGIGCADGTHDFLLNNVEIYNFTLYGFDASPSGGKACYNGTFNNCTAHSGRDENQNVDGFALGHGTQQNFVFNHCTVYDVFDGFDISARNTTLFSCSAHDCWNGGFKLWQDNITLINCLSYHNVISNVELDWDGEPGKIVLQNCNFVDSQVYNIWIENSSDELYMYNCILVGGDNIGLAFEEMNMNNYFGDYNIFHNDNFARVISVGYTDEFSLNDILNGTWANYSGEDFNSLVSFSPENNVFKNLSQWDFHLMDESIAVDAGTSYNAPLIDYDGIARPQGNGYDIGAYEYIANQSVSPDFILITFETKNEIYDCN